MIHTTNAFIKKKNTIWFLIRRIDIKQINHIQHHQFHSIKHTIVLTFNICNDLHFFILWSLIFFNALSSSACKFTASASSVVILKKKSQHNNQTLQDWVDTSAGGLLFSEGIICPVFSVSALTWLIRYIYYWNLQFPSIVIINQTKVLFSWA